MMPRLPSPGRRRRRQRLGFVTALVLFGGGMAVIGLDVSSLRAPPDASFFLCFVFGVMLMVQGVRLATRSRL